MGALFEVDPTRRHPTASLEEVRLPLGDKKGFTWQGIYTWEPAGDDGLLWTVRRPGAFGSCARFVWGGDTLLALSMKSCRVRRLRRAVVEAYGVLRHACDANLLDLDPRDLDPARVLWKIRRSVGSKRGVPQHNAASPRGSLAARHDNY